MPQREIKSCLTDLWFAVFIFGALQDMMDYSASGRIGKKCLSVVDREAGKQKKTKTYSLIYSPFNNISVSFCQDPVYERRADRRMLVKTQFTVQTFCFFPPPASLLPKDEHIWQVGKWKWFPDKWHYMMPLIKQKLWTSAGAFEYLIQDLLLVRCHSEIFILIFSSRSKGQLEEMVDKKKVLADAGLA